MINLSMDFRELRPIIRNESDKDFVFSANKVRSMGSWRGTNDYAVPVCPYHQYPKSKSQIYGQAMDDNITLFSWKYLSMKTGDDSV